MTPIPYQLCPKCHGQGILHKPPHVPGDADTWTSSDTTCMCDVCHGEKIIPQFVCPELTAIDPSTSDPAVTMSNLRAINEGLHKEILKLRADLSRAKAHARIGLNPDRS